MSMMFEQSLLESAAVANTRRGLTTSISALAQLALLAIAVLLPMIFTQNLSSLRPQLVMPLPMPRYTPPAIEHSPQAAADDAQSSRSVVPIIVTNAFPRVRSLGNEVAVANPQLALPVGSRNSVDYNLPLGNPNSGNIAGPRGPVNISHLNEGAIIRRVLPTYPPLAKLARIEGAVVLEAVISRSGRVENLRVISGRPILAGAATDAVSQWQFRPYILNGAPVEVLTQITVEFKLNRGD